MDHELMHPFYPALFQTRKETAQVSLDLESLV